MKLDNHDLEILVLAHITRNPKSMDKLLSRQVTSEHFDHIKDGDKHSYTKRVFTLIKDYWDKSGGSLFTSFVLESKLDAGKASESLRSKLLNLCPWKTVKGTLDVSTSLYTASTNSSHVLCI